MIGNLLIGLTTGAAAFLTATGAEDLVSTSKPFGWFGAILLSLVSAFALYRAGSVRAWKETANARLERIDDLVNENQEFRVELASLREELKIPERIESIIHYMGEVAIKQDAAASKRVALALHQLSDSFRTITQEHDAAAEVRTASVIQAIREEREGRAA